MQNKLDLIKQIEQFPTHTDNWSRNGNFSKWFLYNNQGRRIRKVLQAEGELAFIAYSTFVNRQFSLGYQLD